MRKSKRKDSPPKVSPSPHFFKRDTHGFRQGNFSFDFYCFQDGHGYGAGGTDAVAGSSPINSRIYRWFEDIVKIDRGQRTDTNSPFTVARYFKLHGPLACLAGLNRSNHPANAGRNHTSCRHPHVSCSILLSVIPQYAPKSYTAFRIVS